MSIHKMDFFLTDKEHVKQMGCVCPICESGDIESTDGTVLDSGTAYQDMGCNFCGGRWTDYYRLREYGIDDQHDKVEITLLRSLRYGVKIIELADGDKQAVVVDTGKTRTWFSDTDNIRIKKIKNKKIREEVLKAFQQLQLLESLTQDPK